MADFLEKVADGAQPPRLSDRAYEEVRRMIMELELVPGSWVSEPDLFARLEHSRGSLRAALLRLSQEGLVTPVRRLGYRISPLTIKDARDIFDLRLLLEPRAAYLAAGKLKAEEMQAIERRLVRYCQSRTNAGFSNFLRASRDFRLAVPRAVGNERLTAVLSDLFDALDRYNRLNFTVHATLDETTVERYRELMALLLEGKAEAAEAMMREQLERARDNILQALLSRPEVIGSALRVGGPGRGQTTEPK